MLTIDDIESTGKESISSIFILTRRLVEGHSMKKRMPESVNVEYPVGKLMFVRNSGGD